MDLQNVYDVSFIIKMTASLVLCEVLSQIRIKFAFIKLCGCVSVHVNCKHAILQMDLPLKVSLAEIYWHFKRCT